MTQIERITEMENRLNSARAALDSFSEALTAYADAQEALRELAAYYDGGEWRADFEDDEAGKLPKDLPRGVLSEDEAYDLLSDPGKARTWESQTRRPAYNGGMGANNRGRYGETNGWRVYTYYTGDVNGWNQPPRQETEFHPIVNPFRGIFRFIGGLILFRFIVTLLRWGLFGFFF